MSWYKRTPKVKEPSKKVPHRQSPTTEKIMRETKDMVRTARKPEKDTK